MNVNLFDSIFKIMTEYENLLNFSKNNKLNNKFDSNLNENLNNNEQETFFKYIYNHIKINKSKITLQENIENNSNINELNSDQYSNLSNNNTNNLNSDQYSNLSNVDQYSNLSNTNQDNRSIDLESNNNLEDQNKLIINTFIKKIYKKIILKCHPDKNGDNNLFIKCKEYYEQKFLIGILYIAYIIKYSLPSIDNIIINQILIEIRIIQYNIDLLKEKYIIK
jgi:hypothetical protein